MAHINARLPQEVEIGATRRDVEDVEIVTTDGGYETRNTRASQSLLQFDVAYPASLRDGAVFQAVRAAYKAARGQTHSFDFTDYSEDAAVDELLGLGDGATLEFPLYLNYDFGSESYQRRIYRPVSSIVVKKDGVVAVSGYSVDYATGVLTFSVAPALDVEVTWSGEFNIPVRFDSPLTSTGIAQHLEHIDTFTLQEVRL